jgi:TPR repeat protein
LIAAAQCYTLSADQANADGQCNYGSCLDNVFDVAQDLIAAVQ